MFVCICYNKHERGNDMKKLKALKILSIGFATVSLGACKPKTPPAPPTPTINYVEKFISARDNVVNVANYTVTLQQFNNDVISKTEIDHNNSKIGDRYYSYGDKNFEYWQEKGEWVKRETSLENPLTYYAGFLNGLGNMIETENHAVSMVAADGVNWTGTSADNGDIVLTNTTAKMTFSNVGTTTVNVPEAEIFDERTPYQKWKDMRNLILSASSFTYTTYQNDELQSKQMFAGDAMQSNGAIYTFGDEKFKFTLEDGIWYREDSEEENPKSEILSWLEHWSLDETMYFIEDDAEIMILKDNNTLQELYSSITKDSMVLTGDGLSYEFTNINNTKVNVPTDYQIKEPPVVEQMIKNEDGTYNLPLIKSVLTNWMMGDNTIYPGEELMFKWSSSHLRAIKAINVSDLTAYIDVYKGNGSTFLCKLSITDANILNNIANDAIQTETNLADALREISWRKVDIKTEIEQDMEASNSAVVGRAQNALNYLGIEEQVLFAYETGKVSSSLTFGAGLDFNQCVFTSTGKLYTLHYDALSKNDVIQNTNKWTVEKTAEKQLDEGNVAFYQEELQNELGRAK